MEQRFPFDVDPTYQPLLLAWGVTRGRAAVELSQDRLEARFGYVSLGTELSNIADARVTGPYKAHRAIGVRTSLTDRGLTFGSNTRGGLCILFHRPVPGWGPTRFIRHPGLTVTVRDPEGLRQALVDRGLVPEA
jgi:hypothetical protein